MVRSSVALGTIVAGLMLIAVGIFAAPSRSVSSAAPEVRSAATSGPIDTLGGPEPEVLGLTVTSRSSAAASAAAWSVPRLGIIAAADSGRTVFGHPSADAAAMVASILGMGLAALKIEQRRRWMLQ